MKLACGQIHVRSDDQKSKYLTFDPTVTVKGADGKYKQVPAPAELLSAHPFLTRYMEKVFHSRSKPSSAEPLMFRSYPAPLVYTTCFLRRELE